MELEEVVLNLPDFHLRSESTKNCLVAYTNMSKKKKKIIFQKLIVCVSSEFIYSRASLAACI